MKALQNRSPEALHLFSQKVATWFTERNDSVAGTCSQHALSSDKIFWALVWKLPRTYQILWIDTKGRINSDPITPVDLNPS